MIIKVRKKSRHGVTEVGGPEVMVPMQMRVPGHLARRFHRIHVAIMNEALAVEGLSAATYGALVTIDRTPRITQRSLAQSRGLDPVSAGQIIDELQDKNLVRRVADPNDRRTWRIELTAKGKKIRDRARPIALAAQKRLLSSLSSGEVSKLQELLARVIDANAAYDQPGAGRKRFTKTE